MSYHYPIWNVLNGLPYKTSKDFGARDSGFSQDVYVGTSAKNSHQFARLEVHRSADGKTFTLYVDGRQVKRERYDDKWELAHTSYG